MAPKSKKSKIKKVSVKSVKRTNLKKEIKTTMNDMAETKHAEFGATTYPFTLQPTTPSLTNNCHLLTPGTGNLVIAQGTGQGDRIGNRIAVHKATLSFCILPEPNSASNNPSLPQVVRLYFCRYKVFPTDTPPLPSIVGGTATFFKRANTSEGFRGNLQDLNDEVNNDAFTLLGTKTYKVGTANVGGTNSATNSVPDYQYFANNDFKMFVVKKIDITKWMPKKIYFNDNVDQYAQNLGLFVLVQTIPANGITPLSTRQPIEFAYRINIDYKDF